MRSLFDIDTKDYDLNGWICVRPSARSIIIKNNKIAMVHSLTHGFYKFPGGGIEPNETPIEAMIRETKEESGLIVKANTIKEFGQVHRIQKGDPEDVFIQDNYYYLCDAEDETVPLCLDEYEENDKYSLEFVDVHTAIKENMKHPKENDPIETERETRVLEILLIEGLVK